MDRSVTESPRAPKSRRILHLTQGIVVGLVICGLVVFGFDWLMAGR